MDGGQVPGLANTGIRRFVMEPAMAQNDLQKMMIQRDTKSTEYDQHFWGLEFYPKCFRSQGSHPLFRGFAKLTWCAWFFTWNRPLSCWFSFQSQTFSSIPNIPISERRPVCPTEYTCSWWAGFDTAKHNWRKAVVRGCRLPTSLHLLENFNGRQGQRRPQTNWNKAPGRLFPPGNSQGK